ncbi:GlxA family transcriptional regulator [Burkholderia vietnamiensis]|uniref:GlxA family transcriptional regulator n=1 Tax=Burkholderia vietnamiensis TaxID=60552 RepID=UPI002652D45A|nr:GlxA family transcriptional regulator [Burkholderia vietnamiensis]MDN8035889.1 GlxA family transcriptional regulator [Burkholderia vietnamiensis]
MVRYTSVVEAKPPRQLRFGIILLPNFTLTAFSGFVDLLRLASDEGDMSRPVRCTWTIIGENLLPVHASCGIQITPWTTFDDAPAFDYVVVVGGLLRSGPAASHATLSFIRAVTRTSATLVGICTGAFALVLAGVMNGYRTCVSWFHYWDFVERFPRYDERNLVADRLFVIDGKRITCSGGRATIDVAAAILLRHFEATIVRKALRILLVDEAQKGNEPQPHPRGLAPATHPKVRRAVLLMEQHVGEPLSQTELARRLDVSTRQITRLFIAETGKPPSAYARQIRMRMASWLLLSSDRSITDIATSCGFADASHLGREFKKEFGETPTAHRATHLPDSRDAVSE